MEGEQDAVDELKAFAWQQSIYYRREAARSAMAEMWRDDHCRRFGCWPQI